MSKNNESTGGGVGCALVLMFAVIAMPFVGLYLIIAGKSDEQKLLGIALLVVSIIVYIKLAMIG